MDRTIQMMVKDSPSTTTKFRGLVDTDIEVPMQDCSIPILQILEGGMENPFQAVNLEESK